MNQFLVMFETGEMRIEKADDDSQVLRMLGERYELSKVVCIYCVRKLNYDINYYEDLSQENDDN